MILLRFMRLFFVSIFLSLVLFFPFIPNKLRAVGLVYGLKMGGVAFVKLGQSLAVRSDVVGVIYANALRQLQDNMPVFSFNKVKSSFKQSFGLDIADAFKDFTIQPVGSASIAQVHKATLHSGENVAVKVLRPNIKKIFLQDIAVFYKIVLVIEFLQPKTKRLQLTAVVREMHKWVLEELDLNKEALNAKKLSENFIDNDTFVVPKVYSQFTCENVLTTAWINGVRIDDIETIKKWGLSVKDILANSARVFFLQVFRDGFFHADMHPGNMFVTKDGTLMPVDFGIMGNLTKQTRIYVADVMYYIVKKEYYKVAQVHFNAGYIPSTYSIEDFADAIGNVDNHVMGKGDWHDVSMGTLLHNLFKITAKFQMKTRPELLLLQKTIVVAEGVGRIIAPNENMWLLIADTMEEWMRVNRGIGGRIEILLAEIIEKNNS